MSEPFEAQTAVSKSSCREHNNEFQQPLYNIDPEIVKIPDLFVSFISRKPQLHPEYESIKAESDAWMMQ